VEFFTIVGRYFLPLIAFFVLLNCAFSLLKGNKKPGTLGYLVNSANGDRIPLKGFETSVGRSNSCDIVLSYNTVSRFHAVLSKHKKGWYVADTNSKTGTFINTQKVDSRAEVENGDSIVFGNAVFRFVDALVEQQMPHFEPEPVPKLYIADEEFFTGDVWSDSENSASCAIINDSTGETFLLDNFQTCLIGRSSEAQIQIDFPSVSRNHALLSRQGNRWLIEDLDSTCGTFLNSNRIYDVQKLANDDILDIGGNTLVFKSNRY
jgi:pSer/pThr/pTyr-binding forkhead associated (FHA) protein